MSPKSPDHTPKNIEERIRSWLETQGYRFELLVARAFQSAGFSVTVSEFTGDPDSGTPREIDVIATHTSFLTPGKMFDVNFVIECKHSRDKPWIVFKGISDIKPTKTTEFHYRFATHLGHIALLEMSTGDQAQATGLFSLPERMAHGVRRAFEDKTDLAYDAVTKVCSAAAGLITDAEASVDACMIAFPLVSIEGQLFECIIADTTDLQLAEIARATLFWRRPTTQSSQIPVDLVTEKSVEDYAKEKFKQCEALRSTIESGLPKTSGMAAVSK